MDQSTELSVDLECRPRGPLHLEGGVVHGARTGQTPGCIDEDLHERSHVRLQDDHLFDGKVRRRGVRPVTAV